MKPPTFTDLSRGLAGWNFIVDEAPSRKKTIKLASLVPDLLKYQGAVKDTTQPDDR